MEKGMNKFENCLFEHAAKSALYASAGNDTKALVFTEPGFLIDRGAGEVGRISLYVYLDSADSLRGTAGSLNFQDNRTNISSRLIATGSLWGFGANLYNVNVDTTQGSRTVECCALVGITRSLLQRQRPIYGCP